MFFLIFCTEAQPFEDKSPVNMPVACKPLGPLSPIGVFPCLLAFLFFSFSLSLSLFYSQTVGVKYYRFWSTAKEKNVGLKNVLDY